MVEKNIAVFVDYDNIEIGVKSTLSREFAVGVVLDALKERGQIVASGTLLSAKQEVLLPPSVCRLPEHLDGIPWEYGGTSRNCRPTSTREPYL